MTPAREAKGRRGLGDIWLLALAVLVTAATVWLLGRPSLPERGESRLLGGLSASLVSQLSIERAGIRLVLERALPSDQIALEAFDLAPREWVIRGVTAEPVDTASVHGWLGALLSASAGLPTALPLPTRAPSAHVELKGDFPPTQLSFHDGSLGWTVVVQHGASRRAFRVAAATAEACLPSLDGLRDRRVAPVLRRQVKEVTLSRWPSAPGQPTSEPSVLHWKEHGPARLVTPFHGQRPAPSALRGFWLALADLRVSRRLNRAEATQALAGEVRLEVELALGGSMQSLRFRAGGSCPRAASAGDPPLWVVARASPPLFGCLPAAELSPLLRPPIDWVDYSLFDGNVESAQGFSIGLGQSVEVRREDDGYWLDRAEPQPLATEPVRARLEGLLALRGQPGSAPVEPGPPLGEATLSRDDHPTQRVTFYRDAFAFRHVDTTWLQLGGGARNARQLPEAVVPDTTLLRSLQVFDYNPQSLLELEVESSDVQQRLSRQGGELVLEQPSGAQLDATLGRALVKACAQLRARRWVSDRQRPAGYGLSEPRLRAVMRFAGEGDGVQRTLRVGALTRDGFFAEVDRYPGVFVLDREVVTLLSQYWMSRDLFSLENPQWNWVRLQVAGRAGGVVELSRQPFGWRLETGAVRPELQPQLVQALTGVVAERTVRLGAPLRSEGRRHPMLRVSAGSGPGQADFRWFVGARDSVSGVSIHYAWRSDRDEVYAVARARVERVMALLGY